VDVALDDDALMLRIAATRDEDAFEVLVLRWQQPVFGFLWHMLRSREEAEDLTQDVFLKVLDQAPRYRPEGKFRSWLLRIAANRARSSLRRRKVLRWVSFDPDRHDRPRREDNAALQLERDETAARVREAIGRLPQRQQEAVVLRRYQELSYEEIAVALSATLPAVESLLQRAAANLRRELGETELRAQGRMES
jgi:RNA polymerase sigma-70 factor, ECF subfamily